VQFRKSKKFGPFRFTLSNRGLSTSAGAGPLRFSRGLDGRHAASFAYRAPGYTTQGNATGTVLVFSGYEALTARQPNPAQTILDIIARGAHFATLFGHRLLCLVQSNDPDIRFDVVGAAPVMWNPVEWLKANRR
jgi:hypothetical protein